MTDEVPEVDEVWEGSGVESWWGSEGFRSRKVMMCRRVPVEMADEVPDGSGAERWWGSGGFRTVPGQKVDEVPEGFGFFPKQLWSWMGFSILARNRLCSIIISCENSTPSREQVRQTSLKNPSIFRQLKVPKENDSPHFSLLLIEVCRWNSNGVKRRGESTSHRSLADVSVVARAWANNLACIPLLQFTYVPTPWTNKKKWGQKHCV